MDGNSLKWIIIYFLTNLALTAQTKWILSTLDLRTPWLISGFHITVSGLGAFLLVGQIHGTGEIRSDAKTHQHLGCNLARIALFSFLHAFNVGVSNTALGHVSIAGHQITRSISPLVSVLIMRAFGQLGPKRISFYVALIAVTFGVLLAALGNWNSLIESNTATGDHTTQSHPGANQKSRLADGTRTLDGANSRVNQPTDVSQAAQDKAKSTVGHGVVYLMVGEQLSANSIDVQVDEWGHHAHLSKSILASMQSSINLVLHRCQSSILTTWNTIVSFKNDHRPQIGVALALLSVILGALKSVLAGALLAGSNALQPLDALWMMAPLASVICLCMGFAAGELHMITGQHITSSATLHALFVNGLLAFFLNASGLISLKLAGPLTLAVAGGIKQTICILVDTLESINWFIICGTLSSLVGGLWYRQVRFSPFRAPYSAYEYTSRSTLVLCERGPLLHTAIIFTDLTRNLHFNGIFQKRLSGLGMIYQTPMGLQ